MAQDVPRPGRRAPGHDATRPLRHVLLIPHYAEAPPHQVQILPMTAPMYPLAYFRIGLRSLTSTVSSFSVTGSTSFAKLGVFVGVDVDARLTV